MKARNKFIMGLIVVGIALFGMVQGIIIPQIAQNEQQYAAAQQDPLTHDFENILKYKNKYMGNAGNVSNLFRSLPLNNVDRSFQLYPDTYTVQVNYKESIGDIGEDQLDRGLIYNSTAAFALIDNLEAIHFHFSGASAKVLRSDVERWYGVKASTLAEQGNWRNRVQSKLVDEEYVRQCKEAILQIG
ncbi:MULTISPECIES: DUF4825 domain-containing protein [unclassified Paenibacillus]|uniref:DUF4825 domain-containing protein n=1 Tax=unclassified Paenibacillus TaxID=185978 RepID=UPI001AE2AFA3|nr:MULTISPECIES: DUF4825 domain-containing protein [unclassified Paenibacillus]MBP1157383.1 hypothetical protein [Paenibacillus sp. PvP091]MBP1171879.1 hypothetical protein [Paenibacillus sp. PvR098]MBP2438260.1 hypothetical protein [Paenibacillus sp. PvP052]